MNLHIVTSFGRLLKWLVVMAISRRPKMVSLLNLLNHRTIVSLTKQFLSPENKLFCLQEFLFLRMNINSEKLKILVFELRRKFESWPRPEKRFQAFWCTEKHWPIDPMMDRLVSRGILCIQSHKTPSSIGKMVPINFEPGPTESERIVSRSKNINPVKSQKKIEKNFFYISERFRKKIKVV